MNKEIFNLSNLLGNQSNLSIMDFVINLVITGVLTYIIGLMYSKYSKVLSNREMLRNTLVLVGMTTMIIISIVKSSVALSLGLVGALSIVRFRTAVKEPEELAYFFMCIGVGLGMGAGERWVTMLGVTLLVVTVLVLRKKTITSTLQNLIISSNKSVEESTIVEILNKYVSYAELNRVESDNEMTELSMIVDFKDSDSMFKFKSDLNELSPNIKVSFLKESGS